MANFKTNPVILASVSPRRIGLLKQCGLKFRVFPSHIKENTTHKNPINIVKDLALQKAGHVAKKFSKGIIIGADTIVVYKKKIIGKPKSTKDAGRILSMLNGTFHRVYTGIAVIDAQSGKVRSACEVSRVKMRKLSAEEIKGFSGKHMDKAGAYAVQEKDDAFVDHIDGDYYNVVGLPLKKLAGLLKNFKIKLRYKKLY
jgi:septum formation protein